MNVEMTSMSGNWVDICIERGPVNGNLKNRVGLRLHIRANEELEQFMRNISKGKTVPVEALTEDWLRIPQDKLHAYTASFDSHPQEYSLSAIGAPLLIESQGEGEDEPPNALIRRRVEKSTIVNLSFLTLVGISKEEGITLGISGVYSFEYIQNVRNLIPQAIKKFLHDYLVPVTINLSIIQKG